MRSPTRSRSTSTTGTSAAAFTLIEVTAVLVLAGVLAGVAAVSLAGPRHRAVAADAVGQVSFADAQVRHLALTTDRAAALVLDLATGRVSRSSADEANPVTLADLPAGVAIARVRIGADVIAAGTARVPVSAAGRTPSYAVGLTTPAGPRWVVFAGLTGQATAVADESEADAALTAESADGG